MITKLRISLFSSFGIAFLAMLMLFVSACRSEFPVEVIPSIDSNDSLTISGSIDIPDMQLAQTRGAFGDKPNNGLKLTILEFDLAATPAQSFITKVYQAELTSISGVDNGGIVNFKVTLNAATTPKVLHFMVADDYVSIPEEGGSIASLLPSISVGSQTSHPEAYWGYVEFPDGFSKPELDSNGNPVIRDDVPDKLKNIPVIRNFAKITVENRVSNFEIIGFEVLNCPTSGTIAPWNSSSQKIPALLTQSDGSYVMDSYSNISASNPGLGLPYAGILPQNVGFYNQQEQVIERVDGSSSYMLSALPRYLYEHLYEPTRRTYIILQGVYNGTRGFYKLDIGNRTDDGNFVYYNIIRNINYNIVINNVLAPGAPTVAQAIERAPFNNLLAATETSSMLNISDGQNMLIVNDINHIIVTDGGEVKILYRYLKDLTQQDNTVPTYIVGEGDVIKKKADGNYDITEGVFKEPNSPTTEWVELTVKTENPVENKPMEQTITVLDGLGLGRTITLVLHKPWKYDLITKTGRQTYTATVRTGSSNLYGEDIYPNSDPPQISNASGQDMTVYFDLPDGIPDSAFPLDFILEAKYQGLENNKIGTMVVTSGTSLFDPNVTAIQYIKSVSLDEYKYQYNGTNDSSGFDRGKSNNDHTIRCRFTTISSVDNNSDGVIRIYNEYFVNPQYTTADDTAADPRKSQCAEVSFKRVTNPTN